MLSVVPISNKSISQSYYMKEDSGYHIEDISRRDLYQWHGKGAQALGLEGDIDPDEFKALFSGMLPNGEKYGRFDEEGNFNGRPGYDLTFSMNKELSLIVCCTEDNALREKILTAHHEAVKTVLSLAEKAASARVSKNGETTYEVTKNLVVGMCTHLSSRHNQPTVHTHACVANVTERADGKWRTLSTDMSRKQGFYEHLRNNSKFYGQIYQNDMANLAKSLNFEIEHIYKHGMFKIKDFPESIKQHFSKRRTEIVEKAESITTGGSENKNLTTNIAAKNRPAKTKHTFDGFLEKSKADMSEALAEYGIKKSFDELLTSIGLEKNDISLQRHERAMTQPSKETMPDGQKTLNVNSNKDNRVPHFNAIEQGDLGGSIEGQSPQRNTLTGFVRDVLTRRQTPSSLEKLERVHKLLLSTIDKMSTFDTRLDANRVIQAAMPAQLGDLTYKDFARILEGELASERLLLREDGAFSTQKAIELENAFLDACRKRTTNINNQPDSPTHYTHTFDPKENRLLIVKDDVSLKQRIALIDKIIDSAKARGETVTVLTQTKSQSRQFEKQHAGKPYRSELSQTISAYLHQESQTSSFLTELKRLLGMKEKPHTLIIDSAHKLGIQSAQALMDITEKHADQTKIIFLSHEGGHQGFMAGNTMDLLKSAGVMSVSGKALLQTPELAIDSIPLSPDEKHTTAQKPAHIHITAQGKGINETKADAQHQRNQTIAAQLGNCDNQALTKITVYSPSKSSAAKLSTLIREQRIQTGRIIAEHQITLTSLKRMQLPDKSDILAKDFQPGMLIKTYVGRGQYHTQQITDVDIASNTVRVSKNGGKPKLRDPATLISKQHAQVYLPQEINIAPGDIIRFDRAHQKDKMIKGLILGESYHVHRIEPKKNWVLLIDNQGNHIKARYTQLAAHEIAHNYVTTYDKVSESPSHTKAIVEGASRSLSQNLLNDLTRHHDDITIHTDSEKKAKLKLATIKYKETLHTLTFNDKKEYGSISEVVDRAIALLEDREAAFKLNDLYSESLSFGESKHNFATIEHEVQTRLKQGTLIAIEAVGKETLAETLATTPHAINIEKSILKSLKDGKSQVRPFLAQQDFTRFQEKTPAFNSMTTGQVNACAMIATTSDRYTVVQGLAGTGKSTMLDGLCKLLISSGVIKSADDIIGLAPTHQAVAELKDKNIEAQTLKSFLVEYQHPGEVERLANKVVLIDETSMVSNRDFSETCKIIDQTTNTKAVFIQDIFQLLAVESGKPGMLALYSKESSLDYAVMNEMVRPKSQLMKTISPLATQFTTDALNKIMDTLEKNLCVYDASKHSAEKPVTLSSMVKNNNAEGLNKDNDDDLEPHILALAEYFESLDTATREETLIIAATRKDKDSINEQIRTILSKEGKITGQALTMKRLVSSGHSTEGLKYHRDYKPDMVVAIDNHYGTITAVDARTNTITLIDDNCDTRLIRLDNLTKNAAMRLYEPKSVELRQGDVIRWSETDNTRGIKAQARLTVTKIENNHFHARDDAGNTHVIDPSLKQNQHIDYAYASTVHGAQGMTTKSVIAALHSKHDALNHQRLLYVSLSRATDDVRLFTNDLAELKESMTDAFGDKYSALEIIGELDKRDIRLPPAKVWSTPISPEKTAEPPVPTHKDTAKALPAIKSPTKEGVAPTTTSTHTKYKSTTPAPNIQPSYQTNKKEINDELHYRVKEVCLGLLGEPNQKLSNQTTWRYGQKGSLVISVDGHYQGTFKNFETEDKGGMLALIMSEMNVDKDAAYQEAEKILGGHLISKEELARFNQSVQQSTAKNSNKKAMIAEILAASQPIAHTPGEKYLASRGINTKDIDKLDEQLRYIHRTSTGGGNEIRPYSAAVITIGRKQNGEIQAIQLTYIDPVKAQKVPNLFVPKRSHRSPTGSPQNLSPEVKNPKTVFIAEGLETALSIKDTLDAMGRTDVAVLNAMGKSNIAAAGVTHPAPNAVLVLDNDKMPWQMDKVIVGSQNGTEHTIGTKERLERSGKTVHIIQPSLLINDNKTDYNDYLQAGKHADIERDIEQAFVQIENTKSPSEMEKSSAQLEQKETKTAQENLGEIQRQDREIV